MSDHLFGGERFSLQKDEIASELHKAYQVFVHARAEEYRSDGMEPAKALARAAADGLANVLGGFVLLANLSVDDDKTKSKRVSRILLSLVHKIAENIITPRYVNSVRQVTNEAMDDMKEEEEPKPDARETLKAFLKRTK